MTTHHRVAAESQRGASAVEYGLLIAGIAAIIALVVYTFGGGVSGLFDDTCNRITDKTVSTTDSC